MKLTRSLIPAVLLFAATAVADVAPRPTAALMRNPDLASNGRSVLVAGISPSGFDLVLELVPHESAQSESRVSIVPVSSSSIYESVSTASDGKGYLVIATRKSGSGFASVAISLDASGTVVGTVDLPFAARRAVIDGANGAYRLVYEENGQFHTARISSGADIHSGPELLVTRALGDLEEVIALNDESFIFWASTPAPGCQISCPPGVRGGFMWSVQPTTPRPLATPVALSGFTDAAAQIAVQGERLALLQDRWLSVYPFVNGEWIVSQGFHSEIDGVRAGSLQIINGEPIALLAMSDGRLLLRRETTAGQRTQSLAVVDQNVAAVRSIRAGSRVYYLTTPGLQSDSWWIGALDFGGRKRPSRVTASVTRSGAERLDE